MCGVYVRLCACTMEILMYMRACCGNCVVLADPEAIGYDGIGYWPSLLL